MPFTSSTPPPPPSTLLTILSHLETLYITQLLPLLPAPLASTLQHLNPFPILTLLSTYLPAATQQVLSFLFPQSTADGGSSSSLFANDLIPLVLFVFSVYLTFSVANYIRRSLFSWIFFFVKVVLVLALVQVGWYVHVYGVQRALRDAGWIGGILWGWAEEMMAENNNNNTGRGRGRGSGQGYYGPGAGGGGRQQVPVGRGGTKRRGAGGSWS